MPETETEKETKTSTKTETRKKKNIETKKEEETEKKEKTETETEKEIKTEQRLEPKTEPTDAQKYNFTCIHLPNRRREIHFALQCLQGCFVPRQIRQKAVA